MPDPTYPVIPLPDTGLTSATKVSVNRTEMDSGLVRQVARFATGTKTFSASWNFTGEEYALFLEFFGTELENGTKWFEMTLPDNGAFETFRLRFVNGELSDAYQVHDRWVVSATLEQEILQTVPATTTTPTPQWYQPVRNIFIDTALDAGFANNLLVFAPATGTQVVVTVPEILTPSDWLPFGVLNKGPGNVVISVAEPAIPPEPGDTWESTAGLMDAWGIYRWDTGVTLDAYDRVSGVEDLSGNANHLNEDSSTDTNTTNQPGTNWFYRAKVVLGELVTEYPDAFSPGQPTRLMGTAFRGKNAGINFPTFHVIAVVEFELPILTGFFMRLTNSSTAPNELGVKITASPTTKWYQQCGTYQNSNSSYNYPTSGTAKRIVEVISHPTGQFLVIDGVNAGHALPSGINMDLMGFGAKKNQVSAEHPKTRVSAFVIFDNTDHLENATGRQRLEVLRQRLALEFP